MPHQIHYPSQLTYFILLDGDTKHHGTVKPTQCMSSGLNGTLETFTDKAAYEARCAELGIQVADEVGLAEEEPELE